MRSSSLALLALIVLRAGLASAAHAGEHVSIWLDGSDHAVHVAYDFAPGTLLRFAGEERWQRIVRKDWWKHDDTCFTLEGNGIRLGTAERCTSGSIRLDWDERDRPRTYPALVRMRNGGVLVYAGYIEVLGADGATPAEIVLQAPPNGIASFRDRKSASRLVLRGSDFGDDASGWFYIGPDRFEEEAAARVLADDGVPPEMRRVVVDLAPRLMKLYGKRLGVPFPRRPTFFFNWNARESPFRTSQADVVPGGDVRFGITGAAWRDAGPREAGAFAYAAAHELAHLWNADLFHHPDWASAWLHEGNAELLSTAALLDLGEIDPPGAADRVAAAMMECELAARSRAWKDIAERERDRIPYACGFALQFGIAAAARRDRPRLDVFDYWRELWARHPTYYEAVFEQEALARGDHELAALLRDTFTASLPAGEAVRRLLSLGGIRLAAPRTLGALSRRIVSRRIMATVMRLDCQGRVNYAGYEDHFEVVDNDVRRMCATLQNGMRVVKLEGLDIMKDPLEIGRRLERSCGRDEAVTVGTRDGRSIAIPCSRGWAGRVEPEAVQLDPGQVAAILGAASR